MKNIQQDILTHLRSGAASSFTLANLTGYAVSSIRREIQVLRTLGHTINDARDNNGLYRLVTPTA